MNELSKGQTQRLAWPVAWGSATLISISLISFRISEGIDEDLPISIVTIVGTAFLAILGGLIASRTGNAIGWLYLGVVLVTGLGLIASAYAEFGIVRGLPGIGVAAALVDPLFFTGLAWFVAFFFLFPTGRLPSPRWRWIWRIYLAALATNFVGFLVDPRPNELAGDRSVANPLGIDGLAGVVDGTLAVAGMLILASAGAAFVSIVVRFRQGAADERQQIRWLIAVGGLAAIALAMTIASGVPLESAEAAGRPLPRGLEITNRVSLLTLITSIVVGIPLVTAIAILKYRLYDLDIVVRKTVVFAILAGFVTIVYVGTVVLLSGALDSGSLVTSIAATALVAGLFQPVRGWATGMANRLVYGRRAEPYEVLSTFSDRIGATYAAEDVLPRMAHVIAEGIAAERAEIWLRQGDTARIAAAWPSDGPPLDPDADIVPVRHRDDTLGEIRVRKSASEPLTPTEEKLLADLAAQAGLMLRNVGLTVDLEARVAALADQAAELRASRTRLVEAHDAERRRLERNIHDGAQQHLVALAVKLRLAKTIMEKDLRKGIEMLRALADETEAARATLLDLASGIYPAVLEERGVGPALEQQSRKGGVPVVVETNGLARLPIETEAAVYFVCLEAIQNAVKYARAARIDVRLRIQDDHLEFVVADDGGGFDVAAAEEGSGLRNMRDRLRAFGGDVAIASQPGRGTTVRGTIPLSVGAPR